MAQQTLLENVRVLLAGKPGCRQQTVFGLPAFLLHGRLCCAVDNSRLLVRVDQHSYRQMLDQPAIRPFVLCGQPLTGWLLIDSRALGPHELLVWVEKSCRHVSSLPMFTGMDHESSPAY